jgi:hypothetical protein
MSTGSDYELRFSRHARDRMLDFGLDVSDIRAAVDSGETIEEYEDSRLLLGRSGVRPVHVVVRDEEPLIFVITATSPTPSAGIPPCGVG